jgi:hypothetical protein
MRAGNCSVKRRMNQMDTGENRLNAEMMRKLYEAYKNTKKKKLDEFNEAARKIISDKEYPEAEDVLKLVEGEPITDNHERRIHDPSIFKYHGKALNVFFDEPYPVMMPEDVKTMKGVSDDFMRKFREYFSEKLGKLPRPTITIDSIPDSVREEAERKALIYGDCYIVGNPIKDMNDYITLTGTAKNFKLQQTCDQLEALVDILDTEATDRNGRVWKREFMKKVLNNQIFLTIPRGHKSWLWLKLLEMQLQKSYEINLVQTLESPPSTKVDLKSVIYMKWPKPDLSDLKAQGFKYDTMWQDPALINYATMDISHINTISLESLRMLDSDINSGYGLSSPNLNDIDKKKLERVIKRRKKK